MRILAPLVENPWCLVLMLLLMLLLIGGSAVVAYSERRQRARLRAPATAAPARHLVASAPLQGLARLHDRLVELEQHLPPGSEDGRWLRWFAGRLRLAMDEAYGRLQQLPPSRQVSLLSRLGVEVEALASVVNLQLGARLTEGTDRQALEAQLAALRASLDDVSGRG